MPVVLVLVVYVSVHPLGHLPSEFRPDGHDLPASSVSVESQPVAIVPVVVPLVVVPPVVAVPEVVPVAGDDAATHAVFPVLGTFGDVQAAHAVKSAAVLTLPSAHAAHAVLAVLGSWPDGHDVGGVVVEDDATHVALLLMVPFTHMVMPLTL